MAEARMGGRRHTWTALTIAWFVVTAVAWAPPPIASGLDNSWTAVLHYSHGRGVQFGRDLVFTYGPLGFALTNTYYPSTYLTALSVQLLMVVAGAVTLDALRARLIPDGRIAVAWLAIIPVFTATLETPYALLLLLIAWRVTGAGQRVNFVESLMAVTLGVLSLTKFTYLVATAAVMVLLSGEDLWRWRRFPVSLFLTAGTFLATWIATGQELAGLPTYLRQSWEIARAYTDAMAVTGRSLELLGFALSALVILTLVAFVGWRRERWQLLPTLGMFTLTLLLIFKAAFVRADGHVEIGFRAALVAALLVIPLYWRELTSWRSRSVFVAAALLPILLVAPKPPIGPWIASRSWQQARDNVRFLIAPLAGLERLERNHKRALGHIAAALPVPHVDGPVDVYNAEQSLAIAHQLDYRPRPIIQSYSAYSAPLLQQNRDFLTGPRAPQTIFWKLEEIDGRLPMLMDSLSWPEVLARYRPVSRHGPDGSTLRLERRERPARVDWIPLGVRTGTLGERLALDDLSGRLVWARLRLRPTLLKRLASVVYKPHRVSIEMADGAVFRLIPEMAAAGFLLSPRVDSSEQFASLYELEPNPPLEDVSSILVRARRSEYEAEFDVELTELRIGD